MDKFNYFPAIFFPVTKIAGNETLNGSLSDVDNNHDYYAAPFFLFDQSSHLMIGRFYTGQKGMFNIDNINLKDFKYFIIAHHPTGELNGVLADNIGGENVDN